MNTVFGHRVLDLYLICVHPFDLCSSVFQKTDIEYSMFREACRSGGFGGLIQWAQTNALQVAEVAMTFHDGEKAVQGILGVGAMAERAGRSIGTQMPDVAQDWLRDQQLAAATTVAPDDHVWVSLLTGAAGFLTALDATTLRARPAFIDETLRANLAVNAAWGLIVLEPAARRRMRINGEAVLDADSLTVRARQVYANCPKYIQARHVESATTPVAPTTRRGRVLSDEQRALVARADTFFIGSFYDGDADASHRGGLAGFVRATSETQLQWLDYPGNTMFNTFGNLHRNARCGLLFVDWESGRTLQLSGTATLQLDDAPPRVCFHLSQWRDTSEASPLRWHLDEMSPFNPPL